MAIETRGFNFNPGESRLAQIVAPPQFQLASGASLVGDSGISEWAAGMSNASRMMRENMSSLLAGVTVGVEGITSAIGKVSDRKFEEEQADKKYERDVEIARIRAQIDETLTPEEKLDLQLKELELREAKRKESWSEWPEGSTPPPLSEVDYSEPEGGAFPDPNLDIAPEEVPIEPLPEEIEAQPAEGDEPALPGVGEEKPLPAVQKPDREVSSSGRYRLVTFPDGSTQVKDMAENKLIGTRTPPKSEAKVPEGYEPESITVTEGGQRVTYKKPEDAAAPATEAPEPPEGMRLKTAKVADGKTSYEYEVDMSSEDAQREIAMAESAIKQADRVSDDIDTIIGISEKSTLPSVGRMSEWINTIPVDTAASDIRRLIANIQADVAFSTLAKMRRESKTGGALGAVSEKELTLLQAAEGSIDPTLSPALFVANLKRVKEARNELAEMYRSQLKKLSTQGETIETPAKSEADNSRAIAAQIKDLRSSITRYRQGSEERANVINQIKELTAEHVRLTGRVP
jgi:hypothetical protein